MNAQLNPATGTLVEGGHFAGRILIDGRQYGLVVAPKAEGEHEDAIWIARYQDVPAARSYFDGAVNTTAMAEAGSKLAAWALDLNIGGYTDWYLPAQDELEICYRTLKPTADGNSLYARSGINLSAVPPTYPYTAQAPAQTPNALFRDEASEAFAPVWYWSSTQHAALSLTAWAQYFFNGHQYYLLKDDYYRARAVRRFPL